MDGNCGERHGWAETRIPGLLGPVAITLAAFLVKAAFILQCDIRRLAMAPWVLDDSFIFMRIARNLALGLGYSYDGVRPTSGAAPLWIWLTSLSHVFLGPELAAKATLIESAFFGAGSAIVVFAIARRLFNRSITWMAFALVTLLTPLLLNSVGGMDAPLFTFLGLMALWFYLGRAGERATSRDLFLVGCLLGLVNLARADGVFLSFAVVLVELARAVRSRRSEMPGRLRGVLALVFGIALLSLPLAIVCLRADGTFIPTNQAGRRLIAWEIAHSQEGRLLWRVVAERIAFHSLNMQSILSMAVGSTVLAALSVVSGLLYERGRRLAQLVAVYCVSYVGMLVLYQWYFWDVHGLRYLNLPAHVLSILMAAFCYRAVAGVTTRFRLRSLVLAGLTVLILVSSWFQYRDVAKTFDPAGQRRVLPIYSDAEVAAWWSTIDWIAENLPQGTAVATSDHGALAYFTGVRIVDLDGIVDAEPVRSAYDGTIAETLTARNVQYVLFWPESEQRRFYTAIRADCVLEPVPGAPGSIYRFRGPM